jgi:alcohol dehydrogenase class IV
MGFSTWAYRLKKVNMGKNNRKELEMSQKDFAMKFDFPTSWQHGRGLAAESGRLLKNLGCKTTLVVTDKLLVDLGILKPITTSLDAFNITHTVCDEVTIEPTVALFEDIVNKLDLKKFDSVIAVGGGSVIDVAKGLTVIAKFGGSIRDYAGFDKVPDYLDWKSIMIPTTAGTGSEISEGVVLIDESIQSKILVLSLKICPTIALTDPEMTISMPPNITVNSGIDALVHAIESYTSIDASALTEPISIRAIELIRQGLIPAYRHGDDLDAREAMQIGSTMAMVAGMNAHMGLCHSLAMPLCAIYHMPHGQACGMALAPVLEFNSEVVREKVINIFKVMGFIDKDTGDDALTPACYEKIESFLGEIDISAKLGDFGYKDEHMETIVNETMNAVQRQFNPRKSSEEDIAAIVRSMI